MMSTKEMKMNKIWFWIFRVLCLILLSIVPYLAWTNQLTFREGTESLGKIFFTVGSLIYYIAIEFILSQIKNSRIA